MCLLRPIFLSLLFADPFYYWLASGINTCHHHYDATCRLNRFLFILFPRNIFTKANIFYSLLSTCPHPLLLAKYSHLATELPQTASTGNWRQVLTMVSRIRTHSYRDDIDDDSPTDNESVADGPEVSARIPSYDDLSILSRAQLPQGRVSFWKEFEYEPEGRPYVRVYHDTPMSEFARLLEHDWKMLAPAIVLQVISSVRKGAEWTNHRQWANLQEGLIAAANKTEMWIITHGFNCGVAKMLGDVVNKEIRRRQAMTCYRHQKTSVPKLPQLTLLGIVRDNLLLYEDQLDGKAPRVEVDNQGNRPQESKYELNPNHTHFIITKDNTVDRSGLQVFSQNLAQLLKSSVDLNDTVSFSGRSPNLVSRGKPSLSLNDTPLIGLLIGGGYSSCLMVLDHLKNKTAVVVVKGSGGAADLLAFAYEEVKETARAAWDPDYIETFITSELSKKIAVHFEEFRDNNLARNKFRDRILECVRHSHKGEMIFLTFVDIHSHDCDLTLLNQHLVRALFKSEGRVRDDTNWYNHMQKDLYLTLDWNCPHIAQSEIFAKDAAKIKIDKKLFEQALLRQDRESFIELFLDQGFQIHKFLSEKRLTRLFEKAENPEFFRSVCLEAALGYSFSLKLDKQFLKHDLNWLVHYLTKLHTFIDVQDLTSNAMGTYTVEPPIAERRAQNALVVWSVLMNRPKVAKVFWKRSDHPIHLAIMISMLYGKLVMYVKEKHLSKELEDRSKEFADMAVGILDVSFQASNCRAFDVLSEEICDWNFKSAVELAAVARNRAFISHPCCQKWLTALFYGDLRIRELKVGFFTVPPCFKIITSAIFIFPMYFWIHFKTGQKRSVMGFVSDGESEEISENESDPEDGNPSVPTLSRMCSKEGRSPAFPLSFINTSVRYDGLPMPRSQTLPNPSRNQLPHVTFLRYLKPRPQPPLLKKISILWNAPVTKFWMHQIFYVMYLALFSLTVLWPSCGNFYLDAAIWLWTAIIFGENVRTTYIRRKKYSSIPIALRSLEIFMIALFLILFLTVRILPNNDRTPFDLVMPRTHISPYTARVIMCLGLLYFYYRFIWIYFPISPTLGPLLFRIRLMVTQDFVHFLRLALLFIISSGIVIHSVIYPDYPINQELLRRVFHKAWFTLFLTPITDLEETDRCLTLQKNDSDTCTIGRYYDVSCPNPGVWPYIMTIQYHIILKLILLTLLFALFSDTAASTTKDADAIWRYQRYHLVLDFSTRFRLPAPLSIFSFAIVFVKKLIRWLTCQDCRKATTVENETPIELAKQLRLKVNDCNYWRTLAMDFSKKQDDMEKEKNLANKQMDSIVTISEDVDYQKSSMHKLKNRITELEKIMLSSRIALEEMRHILNKEDEKLTVSSVHLLSRQSPYPDTRVKRFPLADKFVPWEVLYTTYDPVMYSKPRAEYSSELKEFVDEDLLWLREQQGSYYRPPDLKWNLAFTSGAGVTIDRTSWVKTAEQDSVIYKLDSAGLPVNPMGRTGLRGRGNLYRWGPNHCILLLITRLRAQDSFLQSVQASSAFDHKVLEFVVKRNRNVKLLALPGGFAYGERSVNDVIRKQFAPSDNECWTQELMKKHFEKIAAVSTGDFIDIVGAEAQEYNFEANQVLRGYLDDERNTDNAWIEADVWHYHYTGSQTLDLAQLPEFQWKRMSSNMSAKMPASHVTLIIEIQQRLDNVG